MFHGYSDKSKMPTNQEKAMLKNNIQQITV